MNTAAMTTISLLELQSLASLQTRVDRKYLVPEAQLESVLAAHPGARLLEIDGLTEFGYASGYLDTPDLASYHLAARGRRRRWKVRTRTYLDSGARWLEVKTRSGRCLTVKDRAELSLDDPAAPTFLGETLMARTGSSPARLVPSLDVRYHRVTLHLPGPDGGNRVTIDRGVTWSLPGETHTLRLAGHAVVETKTTGPACAVDSALRAAGIRPARISKYATGLTLVHGRSLPDNRWHRTLGQTTPHLRSAS